MPSFKPESESDMHNTIMFVDISTYTSIAIRKPVARRRMRLELNEESGSTFCYTPEASNSYVPPTKVGGRALEALVRTAPLFPDTPLKDSSAPLPRPFLLQRKQRGTKSHALWKANSSFAAPPQPSGSSTSGDQRETAAVQARALQASEPCFIPEMPDWAPSPGSCLDFPSAGRRLKMRKCSSEEARAIMTS
jgi:hypothetical protein